MDFEDLDSAIAPGSIKEAHSTLEVHFSECMRLLKRPCNGGREGNERIRTGKVIPRCSGLSCIFFKVTT